MSRLLIAVAISLLASGHTYAAKQQKTPTIPAFSAKSFLIADADGTVLKELDGDAVRPIASISKLMIGLLAAEQDLDTQLTIPATRNVQSGIPRKTTSMSRRELLTLALVRSDNFAAQILCDNLPNCVINMNTRAQEIGMWNTHINEPTGLDVGNVSTARDLLKLMLVASTNPIVAEISSMPRAEIVFDGKTTKLRNTNPLTSKFAITLSKTGYTNPAGGCLVMIVNLTAGQRILILLGSRDARTRIPDMERLVKDL